MIDQEFYVPREPVSVVAVGDSGEALLIRAILENLGAVVSLHLPGTPDDFLRVLGQGETASRVLVICGHGDDNGFVFGTFAVGIDTSSLIAGSMPAAAIASRVDLPGSIVVSTACSTGSRAFGEAFILGGTAAYIAPDGQPDGADVVLFAHQLLHQLLVRKAPPQAALNHARNCDEANKMFTGYWGSPSGAKYG